MAPTSPVSSRRSLVTFLAAIAAIAAVLTWLAGWALPVVIFAIIVMIMGHEFGHFITAKRAGMRVTDFFVGFGPVIWSTTRGETRYGVRALPLGGYVKVPGMTWTEEIDPAEEHRTYRAASYPRKALFASAGSLMHVVMALVLGWASLALLGLPSPSHIGIASFTPWDGHSRNAAQLAGMKVGDQIVSINGRAITDANKLINLVQASAGHQLTVVVARHGHDLTLHAKPVDGRTLKVEHKVLFSGASAHGYLGIQLENLVARSSALAAVPKSFHLVASTIGLTAVALVHVFSPGDFSSLFHQVVSPSVASKPAVQQTRPSSIVGITRIAVQSSHAGVGYLLYILMAVNVSIGLLNMIPMLPLDGGYVAVATYERLRSWRGRRYHADINRLVPFAYAFMAVLLVLFLSTMYLDIAHPMTTHF